MGLRKGHCYSTLKDRPYTRKSKVKSKSYIKTTPPMKIAKFVMGDISGFFKKKYHFNVSLIATEPVQIRDNAIEASRQVIHRHLEKKTKGAYYFVVNVYPHHVLRENKMLTGAGADRMQTGMQLSFGKPVGIAARINTEGRIFSVACNKGMVPAVRNILLKVKSKLPGKKAIIVKKLEGKKER